MTCRHLSLLMSCALPLAASCLPAMAQETVLQVENVRVDYARVLRVEPVFQTLNATSVEERCDDDAAPSVVPSKGISRLVGKVRDALTPEDRQIAHGSRPGCRTVNVQREYRRPIAYDVDYIYRGMKYRSRLAVDPGNRLRIRVSVTPYLASEAR
ncbi:hypothetical protein [Cognatiluteimonas telluris]|jgi:uncharacterized protein YcfJ|uniref:hypothetical protein n=1 Tax=Cognatiluteimonas telluris TaxID=1104775 RepID=UPI001A9C8C00|nr:hypothetical protein [Lysobacter telluris]